jgi:H+/gluconate symporter-like permease
MNLQLLFGIWVAILAAYATVAFMRWHLGRREDDHLHFAESEQQLVVTQSSIAHKLDVLDRWKTALLVLTIVSGLIVGALHVYSAWQTTSSTVQLS